MMMFQQKWGSYESIVVEREALEQGGVTTIHSVNAFPTGGFDRPLTPNLWAWSHFPMG